MTRWRLALLLGMIGAAVGGLLLAFSLSMIAAARQFDHALIARRQAALVVAVARDVQGDDARALPGDLEAYRASIREERQFLDAVQLGRQETEMVRADALIAMARRPADRGRLIAMVAAIAAGEQREVERARADLDHIRKAAMTLGTLLAMAAVGVATAGGMLLLRANRDLSGEVAARTAELRAIDSSRRLFFAKASHEMRTPVTAIRAIAEVAMDSGDTSPTPLRNIAAQTIFLGHRIEDMLALSQAAQGRPIMALGLLDLTDVVAEAVSRSQPYAHSVQVAIRFDAAVACAAIGDRRWLVQALVAILDNGIKFSDPGGVLVVTLERDGALARIAVADTGPGILPPELPRIFDAYYQAEAGRMRGGTGLGLALSRWVVEEHGGVMFAENREEGGCRIVMTLALKEGQAA